MDHSGQTSLLVAPHRNPGGSLRFTFCEHSFWFKSSWRQSPAFHCRVALLICLSLLLRVFIRLHQLWALVGWTHHLSPSPPAITGNTGHIDWPSLDRMWFDRDTKPGFLLKLCISQQSRLLHLWPSVPSSARYRKLLQGAVVRTK